MKEVSGIAGGVTDFRQGSQGQYLPGDPDLNEENESRMRERRRERFLVEGMTKQIPRWEEFGGVQR